MDCSRLQDPSSSQTATAAPSAACCSLSMKRPTPDPSQEGSKRASAPFRSPSWEGLGVGSWSERTGELIVRGGFRT